MGVDTELDFQSKLRQGYYTEVGLPYPSSKKEFTRTYVDEKIADFVGTKVQIQAREQELVTEAENLWKLKKEAYQSREDALLAELKHDLFSEHGVLDNPKNEKCFQLAWDEGHSAGLSEVAGYFAKFVELILD